MLGDRVSAIELIWCLQMWSQFNEWYKSTEAQVFNKTMPLGSNAHKNDRR